MFTVRSHDQYNTTVYGLHDRYRGIYFGRRVVLVNKEDMVEHSLFKGTLVNIESHFNGERRVAEKFKVIPYDIPKGQVATYFPEANVLIPLDSYADKSYTPTSKSVNVTLKAI